jgi:hypothetical protein
MVADSDVDRGLSDQFQLARPMGLRRHGRQRRPGLVVPLPGDPGGGAGASSRRARCRSVRARTQPTENLISQPVDGKPKSRSN